MATATLEERVSELERKLASLTGESGREEATPWWQQWFGAFENSPDFDAAMERGAEYRRTLPNAADDFDAVALHDQDHNQ